MRKWTLCFLILTISSSLVSCSSETAQQHIDAGCQFLRPSNRGAEDYRNAIEEFRKATAIDSGYLELLTATENLDFVRVTNNYEDDLTYLRKSIKIVKSVCDIYIVP